MRRRRGVQAVSKRRNRTPALNGTTMELDGDHDSDCLVCVPYHDDAVRMPSYTNRAPPSRQRDLFHIFVPPNPPLQMILLTCPSFPRLIRTLLLHPRGWDCSITRPGACSCEAVTGRWWGTTMGVGRSSQSSVGNSRQHKLSTDSD